MGHTAAQFGQHLSHTVVDANSKVVSHKICYNAVCPLPLGKSPPLKPDQLWMIRSQFVPHVSHQAAFAYTCLTDYVDDASRPNHRIPHTRTFWR
jgi:hypothetical protein